MSAEYRKSYDNGIWLCSNCHDRVDGDESQFTTEFLHAKKEEAEQRAFKMLAQAEGLQGVAFLDLKQNIVLHEERVLDGEVAEAHLLDFLREEIFVKGRGYYPVENVCSALEELRIRRSSWWKKVGDSQLVHGESLLRGIFGIVHELVQVKADFVLYEILKPVVLAFIVARPELVLGLLQRWMNNESPMHKLFAISWLSEAAHHSSALAILGDAAKEIDHSKFWESRALLLAFHRLDQTKLSDPDSERARALLNYSVGVVRKREIIVETRAIALTCLPVLGFSAGQLEEAEEILCELSADESLRWGYFNIIADFRAWATVYPFRDWYLSFALWTLARCDSIREIRAHVIHAVDQAAARAGIRMFSARESAERGESYQPLGEVPKKERERKGSEVAFYPQFVEATSKEHFECRERVQFAYDWLWHVDDGQLSWLDRPRQATFEELSRAHNQETDLRPDGRPWPHYVTDVHEAWEELTRPYRINQSASQLPVRVDMFEAALYSAGSVLDCVEAVKSGARSAWALNRPPGHLANNAICLFNNVAVAAHYAIEQLGLERALVVDFDAHCGLHSARCFAPESEMLYLSFHEENPHSELADRHQSLNEHCPNIYVEYDKTKVGDEAYGMIVDAILPAVMKQFKPSIVLLSAGFDGHREDLLNRGYLSDWSYIHLARVIADYCESEGIGVVGTLEGGYGLRALARCLSHFVLITGGHQYCLGQVWEGPPHLRLPGRSQGRWKAGRRENKKGRRSDRQTLHANRVIETVKSRYREFFTSDG